MAQGEHEQKAHLLAAAAGPALLRPAPRHARREGRPALSAIRRTACPAGSLLPSPGHPMNKMRGGLRALPPRSTPPAPSRGDRTALGGGHDLRQEIRENPGVTIRARNDSSTTVDCLVSEPG